ncbi:hypothetical protein G3580_10940 [Nitrogeniibacter mangrovi]|uniref:Uncharacterized protein n=1 Tax=Nitrogeniibacter mangrovi TaxID=2016596 RepID=A0A6C1B3H7_9RHOO|nr:hypothetical protein [Nitrogeniibacter mangrovi]QID18107.1 hypothetical protein G3580_10940 [Nitrogeniibacter mangrovi]
MKNTGMGQHRAPSLVAATDAASGEMKTVSILGDTPMAGTPRRSRRGFVPFVVVGSVLAVGGALWATLGEQMRVGVDEAPSRADHAAAPAALPRTPPPLAGADVSPARPVAEAAVTLQAALIREPDGEAVGMKPPAPLAQPEPTAPVSAAVRAKRPVQVAQTRARRDREVAERPVQTGVTPDRRDADVDIITAIVRGARGR